MSFALDPIYFFILGGLFFLWVIITKLQKFQKERKNIYLFQAFISLLLIVSIALMAIGEFFYGAILFFIILIFAILVKFLFKSLIEETEKQTLEKSKGSFEKFPGSLLKQGRAGQFAYFIIMFIVFAVSFFIVSLLFPSISSFPFNMLLALFLAIFFTKNAIDQLKKLEELK
jgi:hypothetical protein